MQIDKRRVPLQYQNKVNNAQGHAFEDLIKRGCTTYLMQDRAIIDKTPERDRARRIEQRYRAEIRRCERDKPYRRIYKPP